MCSAVFDRALRGKRYNYNIKKKCNLTAMFILLFYGLVCALQL